MDKGRRRILRTLGASAAAAAIGGTKSLSSQEHGSSAKSRLKRPNILVFLTDDHGQWPQQAYGNTEVHTPNLQQLAERGVRMDNAFTTCPVCSPSRASMLTGRMPSQHGIHDWLDYEAQSYQHPWLENEVLLSELLHNAGYHTGLVGKWHCGQDRHPHRGFDTWFTYWDSQYPHDGPQQFSDFGKQVSQSGFQSDFFTQRAADFLHNHFRNRATRKKPFFLYVSYVDTHLPHEQMPQDLVDLYRDATFRDIPHESFPPCHGQTSDPVSGDPAAERGKREQYYAAASSVDRQVGRVIEALKELGRLDETLVIYTGDHGLNAGQHGMWEKGNATSPQNFFEESIRIGCTLAWPSGGLPRGVSLDIPVNHCDLFQTLVDAAEAHPATDVAARINSPGTSYLPWLRGEPGEAWRTSVICEYGNARMIRKNGYKLILRYPFLGNTAPNELYDLRADPRETVNLYNDQDPPTAAVIQALRAELDEFFANYSEPGHSGLDIEQQWTFNATSPWSRVLNGKDVPPGGNPH